MSKALACIGDWNGTPADRGQWSPHWLEVQAGLRIHSAGPGRHGDIDYVMADCHVEHVLRHEPPHGASRSDHDVLEAQLYSPDDSGHMLTVAWWNVRYGRPPGVVKGQVRLVLEAVRPDVLVLQEAADYHAVLRQLAEAMGYKVLAYSRHGKGHNVILARQGLATHRPRLIRLSPRGWELVAGGTHAPLYAPTWTIAWLRVVGVHMPPSVNWRSGVPYGPVRRVAAYVWAIRKLRSWAKANRKDRRP